MGGTAEPTGLDSGDPAVPQVPCVELAKVASAGIKFYEFLVAAEATGELDLQFPQVPVSH